MSLFTRYREVEAKTNQLLNIDWQFMKGGFCLIGRNSWTFLNRFCTKGSMLGGTEKEFVLRFQIAIENFPRFSWLTLELMNVYEARPLIFLVGIWPGHTLKFCFNIGWRLTRASRDILERQAIENERRKIQTVRNQMQKINNNGANLKEVI